MKAHIAHFSLLLCCLTLTACQTAYFNTMEKLGIHKRDIMVDRIEDARDSQVEAKETFKSALDRFQKVLNVQSTDLQEKYDELNEKYTSAEQSASRVSERIDAIEDVAEALFDEWNEELDLYTNQSLKTKSKRQLAATESRYEQLMRAMRRAEDRMQPVLSALRDQVLYLKHNLNAQAISALQEELTGIQSNVAQLVKDMEVSIAKSEDFIKQLENS